MKLLIYLLPLAFAFSCSVGEKPLPILGEKEINGTDTTYSTIPDFSFISENGDTLNQDIIKGKVYVADFFFTSCPTICPTMSTQMLRVSEAFKDKADFAILSHSIDPVHDTPEVLKKYKEKLGVKNVNWHFLTGDQDSIYAIAQHKYMVSADEDADAEGGFVHSGAFILVDKQKRVRGLYDGTKPDQVDQLIKDLPKLLDE